ncbi:MAG: methyltransferase domain-containing protein [Chloroflexota bacterium]|nr:methyltransferase domain-containing protein [Chloroflexota bacterium]
MAAEEPAPDGELSAAAELARLYDLDLADQRDDIELYLALARHGRPILELACGSGRICVPLAQAGHDVVGVDRDPAMLARAEAAWSAVSDGNSAGSLELIEGDITSLDLARRFELVILGFNGLLLVGDRDTQLAALRVAAAHLAPGGQAVVDVWLPAPDDLAAYDGRLELAWLRVDPDGGRAVAKLWAADYDAATLSARVTAIFDSWPTGGGPVRRIARTDEAHLLGASELLALAERAGLRPTSIGGDYSMAPFGQGSERVVLVCRLL